MRAPRRARRRPGLLVTLLAVVLVLAPRPVPAAWAQVDSTRAAARADTAAGDPGPPPFPPPGRLIDVGGWRLHLDCTGEARAGAPTVVLESGAGDFSVEWSLVQPEVARFARVCSYDRAGDGWSDWGPHPRTMHQLVYELHTLLARAGERPPFVLVGHSYGGWLVRRYAATYPQEVAGMVLVEGGGDDPWRRLPDGRLVRASMLAKGDTIPAVKTAGPLRLSDIPARALAQIRAGARENAANPNPPPRDRLPADAKRMRAWALAGMGHIVAAVNPSENQELAELKAERAKSRYPLGDLPLVVLVRGRAGESGPDSARLEADHRNGLAAVAAMSRRGRLIVAARSGHHIQIQQPELVISAIRDVLEAARPQRSP